MKNVHITFQGGLGNQMFQFLFLNLIRKLGYETYFDVSLFYENEMHNGFVLSDIFEIDICELEKPIFLSNKKIIKKILEFGFFDHIVISEERFRYEKLERFKFTRLIGDWQEQKYVEPVYNLITGIFKFKELQLTTDINGILQQIENTNSVAIHIRNGDYADAKNIGVFGLCSSNYYFNAIGKLKNILKIDLNFFVFSDDIEYAKSLLGNNTKYFFIDTKSEKIDLFLIHKCKHQIIANSTFSWWGASLNTYDKKNVIYPEPWFDYEGKESVFIPEEWIALSKY